MSKRLLSRRSDICSLCDFAGARRFPLGQARLTPRAFDNPRTFTTSRKHATKPRTARPLVQPEYSSRTSSAPPPQQQQQQQNPRTQPSRHITEAELREELKHITAAIQPLLEQNAIPSEKAILKFLQRCQLLAAEVAGEPAIPAQEKKEPTAAASLLSQRHSRHPCDSIHLIIRCRNSHHTYRACKSQICQNPSKRNIGGHARLHSRLEHGDLRSKRVGCGRREDHTSTR